MLLTSSDLLANDVPPIYQRKQRQFDCAVDRRTTCADMPSSLITRVGTDRVVPSSETAALATKLALARSDDDSGGHQDQLDVAEHPPRNLNASPPIGRQLDREER
jgi:hypothetical protein